MSVEVHSHISYVCGNALSTNVQVDHDVKLTIGGGGGGGLVAPLPWFLLH